MGKLQGDEVEAVQLAGVVLRRSSGQVGGASMVEGEGELSHGQEERERDGESESE